MMDFLYGELDSERESDFQRHLDECPDCASELASYRFIRESAAGLPDPEPSKIAVNRILAVSREEMEKPRRLFGLRWLRILTTVCLVAVVGWLVAYQLDIGLLPKTSPHRMERPVSETDDRRRPAPPPAPMKEARRGGLKEPAVGDKPAGSPATRIAADEGKAPTVTAPEPVKEDVEPVVTSTPLPAPTATAAGSERKSRDVTVTDDIGAAGSAPAPADAPVLRSAPLMTKPKPQKKAIARAPAPVSPRLRGAPAPKTRGEGDRPPAPEPAEKKVSSEPKAAFDSGAAGRGAGLASRMMKEEGVAAPEADEPPVSRLLADGQQALDQGEFSRAAELLRSALRRLPQGHPDRPNALLWLAKCYEGMGDRRQAATIYRILAREAPRLEDMALRKARELEAR